MIEGRLNKFLSEISLLKQPFVKDPSTSIENILNDVSKHVEINLVALHKELDKEGLKTIEQNASESVKRVFSQPSIEGLSSILPYLETKTVWHPKGT